MNTVAKWWVWKPTCVCDRVYDIIVRRAEVKNVSVRVRVQILSLPHVAISASRVSGPATNFRRVLEVLALSG